MATSVSTPTLDKIGSFDKNPLNKKLRRGTWTVEEEKYVAVLIDEFKDGHLPLKEGMSLRNFLSKMVRCNPKRISKKFEGSNYNGKQLYEHNKESLNPEEAAERCAKLQELERRFNESVCALAENARRNPVAVDGITSEGSPLVRPALWVPGGGGRLPPGAMFNTNHHLGFRGPGLAVGMGMGMNSVAAMPGVMNPALLNGLAMSNPMLAAMSGGMNPAAMHMMLLSQQNAGLQEQLLAMALAKNQIYERELMGLGLLNGNTGLKRKAETNAADVDEQSKRPINSVSEDVGEDELQPGVKRCRLS